LEDDRMADHSAAGAHGVFDSKNILHNYRRAIFIFWGGVLQLIKRNSTAKHSKYANRENGVD